MRNADRDPERRLPVALMAIEPEIGVPARHAVKLGEDALVAELMRRALRLLRRREFVVVAEHVDPGEVKAPV